MQKTFNYNSAVVAYRIEGEGENVVLLHGFGEDSTIWNEQIAYLENYCKVIVPDLPGSGQSKFTQHEATASTVEYYAGCICTLLKHENINTCVILGHSMGGYITLAIAELFPQFLKGFGLIHSTAFADSEEKKQIRQRGITAIEVYGGFAFLKNTTPSLFAPKFRKEHFEKVEVLIKAGNNFSGQALQQYYRAMMNRPDRTYILKDSETPILFVIGTEDLTAPLKDVLKQVSLPNVAYVHILENTGHMGMWEAKDDMNRAILGFLQDVF